MSRQTNLFQARTFLLIGMCLLAGLPLSRPQSGTLSFSSATYSTGEGCGSVVITVLRTGGTNGPIGVSFATSDGTAHAGSDYTATNGTLGSLLARGQLNAASITVDGGNIGRVRCAEKVDSILTAGYTPADEFNPFAAGTFLPGFPIGSVNVHGSGPAFRNSDVIAAR